MMDTGPVLLVCLFCREHLEGTTVVVPDCTTHAVHLTAPTGQRHRGPIALARAHHPREAHRC